MASVLHWAHVAPPADPRVDRRCCLQALERKVMGGPCAWPRGLLADAVKVGRCGAPVPTALPARPLHPACPALPPLVPQLMLSTGCPWHEEERGARRSLSFSVAFLKHQHTHPQHGILLS